VPHLVLLYTGNIDKLTDMNTLCRSLADAMLAVRDEEGKQVFPSGGTRVLAYPAPHYAVADGGAAGKAAGGDGDYAFMYLNLRMARGRSAATQQRAGEAVAAVARERFDPLMKHHHIGFTVNVDVGEEVFDHKHSTIHPLFRKP
jgi:5-carboxymethyl-2-hydroxymuconate isomerase